MTHQRSGWRWLCDEQVRSCRASERVWCIVFLETVFRNSRFTLFLTDILLKTDGAEER